MAACPECPYKRAFDIAGDIVVENPNGLLSRDRRAAKLNELGVVRLAFANLPEQPSCESIRNKDAPPFACPKAGHLADIVRFILGNPDAILSAEQDRPIGFRGDVQ